MARDLKSRSFTCTPRAHPLMEWTIPAFSFPAEAGPHLPTPKGWKAELAWWLVTNLDVLHRELNPDAVAHLSTNRARRRLTSLIDTNALYRYVSGLPTRPEHLSYAVKCRSAHISQPSAVCSKKCADTLWSHCAVTEKNELCPRETQTCTQPSISVLTALLAVCNEDLTGLEKT